MKSAVDLLQQLKTTDQQWDAPNGWAPLHWIAIMGLQKIIIMMNLQKKLQIRWMNIYEKFISIPGKMMEKYNVVIIDLKAEANMNPVMVLMD